MAINFIKKEDLSHITRTTRQWETTIDRYEIIPKGVLCIELCNDKLTKIKIGNGHLIYEQLPYVSDVNLSDYYTKEETNNLLKDLKCIKIKGEASSLSDLPLRGNEEGDLWFIPKSDPDTHNRYDEYIWYKNKWESFGSSDIDLSEYAKKSYVDAHIQEVQNEITEIIESGYLHKHDNKNILDHTSAVYNVEKDNKLRDLHNYDDTELREKAHTHLNKNILDQTDAVYNRDKDDKLSSLHNYDDTDVKDRISALEGVAHSHSNQDVLDRTTAAFTKEQAMILLDCKDFVGTDGVHDGYHGFVPAPTAADAGKVLGANGQWVEGGSSGGDVVTQGGGIEITTDAQTGVKTVSVNAGTGLSIDPDTGELNADAQALEPATTSTLGGVIIGDGISVDNDGVIDVNTGDGLSVNNDNELEVSVGDGLQIDANGAVEVDTGNGLNINQNDELEVSLGSGLQFDQNGAIEVNIGDGLSINASDEVVLDKATTTDIGGVIVGDNIDVNNGTISVPKAASNKLGVVKPTDGLSIDSNGELSVNVGDALSIDSTDNDINVNVGDGLQINQDNELEVSLGNGLQIDANDDIEINTGDGLSVNQDNEIEVNVGDGLTIDSTNNDINVNTGRALSINSSTKAVDVDIASDSSYGCVKIGEGIDVDQYGIISVDKMVPFRTGDGLELVDESVRLPSGYAKVKYVENPSGAAMVAPFNPRSYPNAKVAVKFSRTSLSSSGNIEYVFGAEIYVHGAQYFNLGFFNKTADTLPLYAGFVYGSNTWDTQTDANGGRSTDIDVGDIIYAECSVGEGLKMNNEQIHNVTNVGGESLPYIDLGVFANRRRADQYTIYTENCFVGRIYSFKIYDGKNVILNLIPAVRLSDNVVGFYSYTNGTFYPSITEVPFTTDMETLDIEVPDWVMNVTPATTNTIGGIKVGSGLSAANDGTLSVNTGDGLTIDTNNNLKAKIGTGLQFDENGAVALEEQPKEYHAGEAISIETVGGLQLTDYSNDDFVTSIASINAGSIVKAADNSSFTLTASNNDCYTRGPSGEANGSYPYNVKASTKYRLTWDSSSDAIHGKVYTYENGLYDTWMHEIDQYDQKYLEFTTKAETTFITTRFGVMYSGDSITYSNVRLYEVIEDEDQYDEISVKYGTGLTVNQDNELEVSYGNGLEIVSNSQYRPAYYFNTQVQCQVHTDNPASGFPSNRTYQKTTTEPALCCIWEVGNSGALWTGPLLVGTTATSVQYTTADTQQTVTYQNTFQYLGQTWYTSGYPDFLNAADHEDKLGHLQYLGSYAAVSDQIQAAKDLINLALINSGSLQAKLGNGLQFDANNAIEVVNGGTEYTAGDGIDIDANDEISVKIGNHLSFDQTTGDINVDDIIEYHGGAATEVVNAAEFTIDKIRWNVSAIRSNSGSEIWIQLRYFGFYDEEYNRFPVSSGVSTWSDGSTVEYYQNRTIESLIANTERLCAKTWDGVRTFTMTFNLTYDISSDNLKYFRYYTGNDESGRDPVSWTIEIHDKVADTWIQVQTVTGATIPTGRTQWTSYFDLNLPPSDGKKINVLVGDGLFIDSTNNDVNVKIGQALSINNSNEIDVNLGRALSINNDNEIDVDIATATSLGVVKAGSGLNIDEFGNLSTQAAPFRIGRALSLDDESVRLPSAYYKAKYVESDGDARCYTGFYPGNYPNAKYVGTASVIGDTNGYKYIFGTQGDNYHSYWSMILSTSNDNQSIITGLTYNNNNDKVNDPITTAFAKGDMIDFEASITSGLKLNNELVQSLSTTFTKSTDEMFIFGERAGYTTKARLYSFKIYNSDDTLLANFVPAVRKSDNEVGFYETVSNQFINSNYYGPPFTTDMDDLDVDDPDWVLNANIATSNSLGVVKPSTGLIVNEHGALTLDKASASTIGGVKVGNNLSIDSNGVLTANIINYSSGHAIEITGDLSIDKFRWEITKNAGDSMVAFRYFEYSDSSHIPFTIQAGTIEWSDGSTVSYPSGYDETFAGMMENRTKCTVTGWGGDKTLIMTFTLSQSIMLSDIAYFRWKTDDYMSGRQPQEFNIYAHDSINDEWILLKEVTDHALVPSSSNTWSTYIDIEPEIEPGAINVKYGNGLTLNQNNELEVNVGNGLSINQDNELELSAATANTIGGVKIGNGLTVASDGTISTATGKAYIAGEGINMSSSAYEFSAENEQYLFKSQVTCELHGDFNREFQKYTDDTALGMVWNVYDSGTLYSGPLFVGLSADAVKYTANSTTYSALGTFSYLGKTWYYSDTQMYVSNIDGTDYDGNMVVDTETYASTSDIVQACKSLIDRARVILKVDEISLLPATEDTLGGIKIGEGLSIDENNVVSSTVYEEGQGITFETSGSTDSFDVKNKQYYFEDEAKCEITGNFGPRAYWRVYTDDPCLAVIFYRSDTTTAPLYIGLTANSVKMYQTWDGNVLGPTGTFAYKGYSWYYTYEYGLYYSSGVDQLGHLQTISGTSSDDLVDVAKHVIDLAELINPGIKTYDVWNTGTGWLNGAYGDGTSDTFYTDWYKEYHSDNTEYFELPKGATEVKLTGISTSDTVFGGNDIDLFNDSKHHIGTFIGESQWHELLPGTEYLQYGVKWSENNDRNISSSDIKSVTLEIKVPKNNAITAKLGDGLTFDENDAITLDESIKLIIHCVGSPIS